MDTVKALVKSTPGIGAEYSSVAVPPVGPNDIKVRVKAAAICGTDIHIYQWTPYAQERIRPPMVFGHEFCGEVLEVGSNVTRVAVGDLIAGETHIPCGNCLMCNTGLEHVCSDMKILGVHVPGAFAEVIVIPQSIAWKVPNNTSVQVGAVLEPVGVGVHAAYKADVRGASVLVTGCGPIGLATIGTVKALGAKRIIATDVSPQRLDMALKYGADIVLNPIETDVVATCKKLTGGLGVDVAIEGSGAASAIQQALASVRRVGEVVLFGLPGKTIEVDVVEHFIYKELTVRGITGREMWRTWYSVMDIVENSTFDIQGLVTHEFSIQDFEEAFRVAQSGTAGKVLLHLTD